MTQPGKEHLLAEALLLQEFSGASVVDASHIGSYAVELAVRNYQVGPLCLRARGADGRITSRVLGPHGKDPVGRLVPHGHLDFTTDVEKVASWWSETPWNIGVRVPETMFVLDADDLAVLAQWEAENSPLPETLTTISGRAAGGKHLWFWHPGVPLRTKVVPKAIDVKTHSGYVVVPPSIHPDTGKPYRRVDAPIAQPPRWLVEKIAKPARTEPATTLRSAPRALGHNGVEAFGGSIADRFNASTTWAEILMPHGWACTTNDTEVDGARWLHPQATSSCSATVRYGCLFVYSTSTVFDTYEDRGYTKFRAYALLNFNGDMSAAAKAIAATRSF